MFPTVPSGSFAAGSVCLALGKGPVRGERDQRCPNAPVGSAAGRARAGSSLRVFAVTQYLPDGRAIWEETVKASGNGY